MKKNITPLSEQPTGYWPGNCKVQKYKHLIPKHDNAAFSRQRNGLWVQINKPPEKCTEKMTFSWIVVSHHVKEIGCMFVLHKHLISQFLKHKGPSTQWEFYLPSEHVSKIGLDIFSPHCPGPEARHYRGQCHSQGAHGGLRGWGELQKRYTLGFSHQTNILILKEQSN